MSKSFVFFSVSEVVAMEGAAAAAATATEVPSTVVVADGKFFHELHAELSSKMQRFGKPKASHILGMLQKLTPDTRKNFGWEGEEISLHNPDHGVREIERTFRKLGWDFNHAKVVPGSRPPDFDLFLMMTKDLARYFDEHPVALKSPGSDAKLAENNAWAAKSTASTASSANSDSGNDTERCSGGGSNRRASKKQEIKYWVKGSKKGSFRITKERRKRGKFVTVVANVGGDVQLMLKELRGALGTGGTYNAENNCLEMQGDCAAAVEKWLVHQQCLVGVTAKIKASITKDEDRKKAKEDAKKVGEGCTFYCVVVCWQIACWLDTHVGLFCCPVLRRKRMRCDKHSWNGDEERSK